MKKLLAILFLLPILANATEIITVVSPYNAGYSGQSALMAVLDQANRTQDRYRFILSSHPGAQGLIALNHTQSSANNRIVIIAAGAVELFDTGKANVQDWVPVHGIGDACWAVVTNWPADERLGLKSLRAPSDAKNLVIGAVGIGSVSHLTGLEMSAYTRQEPLTLLFKSGTEAFLSLASNQGVNITIDSVQTIENMKPKNPNIKMIATICDKRNPLAPHVPTLVEQGLKDVPPVFNIVLASTQMTDLRRRDIGSILDQATLAVGEDRIFDMSGFRPAVIQKMSAQEFFDRRVGQVLALRKKYAKELASRK